MSSTMIQGNWDDLVNRQDLRGRRVRVTVIDEQPGGSGIDTGNDPGGNPWLKSLRAWADSHKALANQVDDSRENIYSGTVDDPR